MSYPEWTSEREYFEAVDTMAHEALDPDNFDSLRSEDIGARGTWLDDEEMDTSGIVAELVDASPWSFITYGARWALIHSRNGDYGLENGLVELSNLSSESEIQTSLAYWTIYADVMERIGEIVQDVKDGKVTV